MFGEVTCDGDGSDLVRPAVICSCHQGKTGIIGIRIIPLIVEAVVLYPTCIYQIGAASELFLINPGIVVLIYRATGLIALGMRSDLSFQMQS